MSLKVKKREKHNMLPAWGYRVVLRVQGRAKKIHIVSLQQNVK
jgi:predicted FMN-binding regulatory protein PaiB